MVLTRIDTFSNFQIGTLLNRKSNIVNRTSTRGEAERSEANIGYRTS